MTHDNFVSLVDVEEFDRPGVAFFSINGNCAIDHCGPHLDFPAAKANERLLISCHVEIAGKNSVRGRAGKPHICALNDFGSVLAKAQYQFIHPFVCFRRDFNPREALVRTPFPDLDLVYLEICAMGQNLIQDLRQNERINNVPT
jgi:hypothetical protein